MLLLKLQLSKKAPSFIPIPVFSVRFLGDFFVHLQSGFNVVIVLY